jgi:16S rRNA A1518/A1519 N6-dimethyltransferase RsmA/KsgA/DIM1 with predicted DNA glycosylase/AP lyase activity
MLSSEETFVSPGGEGWIATASLQSYGAGRVTAIEFDPGLAERLAANFAGQRNVRVVADDSAQA